MKHNTKKEVVYGRENCGVVDRRKVDGKKMQARLNKKKQRGKNEICFRNGRLVRVDARP